ncbi:hypothetical protein M9H77_28663 [Catharanthus roseus]|uniref:Uncharacterized protein n=1 Tax=Catharanthus roseus TaxID=4058 RepID=A0ACC0AHY2_CATRO|nr:hypothetical protein M9H77_28663 [Catharanthus roseus]
MKKIPQSDQGVNSGYDLVFGSVRGLQCTWLVPRTRASSDGVDDSDSGEWIHLKRGVDHGGCGPIGLRGHCIILCDGVRSPSGELARDGQGPSKPLSFRLGVFGSNLPRGAYILCSERISSI